MSPARVVSQFVLLIIVHSISRSLLLLVSTISIPLASSCTSSHQPKETTPVVHANSSHDRLNAPAAIEKVDIDVVAQRSGHSLVVNVKGIGRGHVSGGAMENPDAWHVSASYGGSPLRQVLAGPAKIARQPTGAALGDQWDVEVNFMVAFALPDRAGKVEVKAQAPDGEQMSHRLIVKAPKQLLTRR